jgi:hypothetical protein
MYKGLSNTEASKVKSRLNIRLAKCEFAVTIGFWCFKSLQIKVAHIPPQIENTQASGSDI